MSVKAIPAKNPYKPRCGDLVCGFEWPETLEYLETPEKEFPEGQVVPFCLIHPNGWQAVKMLGITTNLEVRYDCPYTGYRFFSIVPTCLISTDLQGKWGKIIKNTRCRSGHEFVLDHEWHRQMWKDEIFRLTDINKALLGTGYTSGTGINDGGGSIIATQVSLDNGDSLYIHLWEWHNK